jgi:Carboxypeptidase regulatory-like domain
MSTLDLTPNSSVVRLFLKLGFWGLAPLAVALSLFCLPVGAQNATGRILGTVTDTQGAAIPAAKVTVINIATGVSWNTVADDHGAYHVDDLPIGNYSVTVAYPGFTKTVTAAESLNINQSLLINVQMHVGAVSESVQVNANAAQVETQVPTVAGLVTGAPIQNLPLNGRDTLSLAITQAGVTPTPGVGGTATSGEFSIAGGRPDSVLYLLNGGVNNSVTSDLVVFDPNPDTVSEFGVLENNYTAEYGHSAGGVITEETKSGTNNWHGSAFDYLRNTDFDANTFFNNEQPALGLAAIPRPNLKRNQFGGTVGGPVLKNKLFFFFGYEGQRQTQTQTGQLDDVYTPAELTGNFSQAANGLPDPNVVSFLQANPYFQPNPSLAAQGIIAPASIDSVAQNYIKAGLIPSTPTGTLVPTGIFKDNFDQYIGHVDYYASAKDRFSIVLGRQSGSTTDPLGLTGDSYNSETSDVPGFGSATNTFDNFLNLGWTRTISPTKLNVARVVVERLNYAGVPTSAPPSGSTLGVNINSDDYFGPQDISWDSAGIQIGFNPNIPDKKADTTFGFSDIFTWIHGGNTWNFGASFTDVRERSHYIYQTNGAFEFAGDGTGIGSGNDLADFLMGLPDYFYESAAGINGEYQHEFTAFGEDAWQVTPHLTLTMGLRYEYYSPETDPAGQTFDYIPGLTSQRFTGAPPGLVVPGDPGAPRGWYYPDHLDFAPRFGFAWDITGDGKTSLRGGAGVFYDSLNGWMADWNDDVPPFWGSSFIEYYAPATTTSGVNFGFTGAPGIMEDPYGTSGTYSTSAIADPFPSKPPPRNLNFAAEGYDPFNPSVYFVDPHMRTPYIYQYNLTLQRQLAPKLMAEIGYIGNLSKHGITWADENPIVPSTITCSATSASGQCTALSGQRLYNVELGAAGNAACQGPCYSPMTVFDNLINGNYNALLASLTKQTGDVRHLGSAFFTASFTWSHSLDNGSEWDSANPTSEIYFPAADPNAEYGNSDIDLPWRFVFSGGWTLPFNQWWTDGPKRLVDGWTLYPIFTVQSGSPIDMSVYPGGDPQDIPGPSGYGDRNAVRPNILTPSIQIFNPSKVQTITDGEGNTITGNFYFNPADFGVAPCIVSSSYDTCPLGFYGTYRRNSLIGPGWSNLDLALEKRVPLTERVNLAFRAEAFNIFNQAEFENPPRSATRVTSSTFGVISSTLPQRILQLALRLDF